jgi:hypothetical protein
MVKQINYLISEDKERSGFSLQRLFIEKIKRNNPIYGGK